MGRICLLDMILLGSHLKKKSAYIWIFSKRPLYVYIRHTVTELHNWTFNGEQGTAEFGAKAVLKQTNELCFQRQKLPSPIAFGQSKWLGSLGLAQQVL